MYRTSLVLKRVLLFASSSKLKRIEKAPQGVRESFEDFGFFIISLLEARRQERDAPPFFTTGTSAIGFNALYGR